MPRPGPRPYECVRRAWHSERHQPMRGSLIQEIFRVANEVHSPATKKNKEWQEKLPVVVLKAEEIMYSKANSEAEYMDLKTLWERTNDAIDTIIRRDESTETGDLLQPCIEAALHLGCPARRPSRSQRNTNPRCYLSSNAQGPTGDDNATQGNHSMNSQCMINYPTFMKPTTNGGSTTNKFAFTFETTPSNNIQHSPAENHLASNKCLVYPLYYGKIVQIEEPQPRFGIFDESICSTKDPIKTGVIQDHFAHNVVTSEEVNRTGTSNLSEKQCDVECDLSLRLGTFSVPCTNAQNSELHEVEDVGSTCMKLQMNKDLPLFARSNVDDPLNAEANIRKRKALFNHPLENQQFCWQPKLPYGHLTGRMKSAGL